MRISYEEKINSLIPKAVKVADKKLHYLPARLAKARTPYEREEVQAKADALWNAAYHEEMDLLAYYRTGRYASWFMEPYLNGKKRGPAKGVGGRPPKVKLSAIELLQAMRDDNELG